MATDRVNMIVSGRVQGVFFRDYTVEQARRLGLAGWVRNLPDGAVEIEAEGPPGALAQLEQWCHSGSPMAQVVRVVSRSVTARGEQGDFHRRPTPRR